MRVGSLVTVLSLVTAVYGFKDTSPFLLWSRNPESRDAPLVAKSGISSSDEIYSALRDLGCDWETIVIAHIDGLHQSHLKSFTLPQQSTSLHVPYLKNPDRSGLENAIRGLVKTCDAQSGDKQRNVISTDMQPGQDIMYEVEALPSYDYLILSGTPTSTFNKRQEYPFPSPSPSPSPDPQEPEPSEPTYPDGPLNTTLPTGGPLLQRAQFFTEPIVTSLLVTFGILLPILFVGVTALLGIQVPPRMMEIGKGMVVGKERKDQ